MGGAFSHRLRRLIGRRNENKNKKCVIFGGDRRQKTHNNQLKIRRRNDGGVYEDARPDGNVGEHDRIGFGAIELGGGEKIKYNK
jgi:hypothetical protein